MARDESTQGGSGKKRDWKFLLIMILMGVFLFLAAAAGGYYIGNQWSKSGQQPQNAATDTGNKKAFKSSEHLGPLVEMDDFLVNIADGKRTRYLKTKITVETVNDKAKKEIQDRMPQFRDAIIFLLGSKTFDQIRDVQGKKQLRAELTSRLNQLLEGGLVKRVFFTEFVVQ